MRRSEFGRQALFISRHPGAKRLDILIRMDGIEGRTAASGGGAAAGETTFDRFSCRVTVCSESGQAPHDGFKLAALCELVHRINSGPDGVILISGMSLRSSVGSAMD